MSINNKSIDLDFKAYYLGVNLILVLHSNQPQNKFMLCW